MNPLNCKLGFANPFFLSVSCKPFAFVCFLHSMERTLLMHSGQLKFAACLRSSCCSTSTSHRWPMLAACSGGFLQEGSSWWDQGPLQIRGRWKVELPQMETQHPLLSVKWVWFALPGDCPWKSLSSFLGREEQALPGPAIGSSDSSLPWLTPPHARSTENGLPLSTAWQMSSPSFTFFGGGRCLVLVGVFFPNLYVRQEGLLSWSHSINWIYKLVDQLWPLGRKANFSINLLEKGLIQVKGRLIPSSCFYWILPQIF